MKSFSEINFWSRVDNMIVIGRAAPSSSSTPDEHHFQNIKKQAQVVLLLLLFFSFSSTILLIYCSCKLIFLFYGQKSDFLKVWLWLCMPLYVIKGLTTSHSKSCLVFNQNSWRRICQREWLLKRFDEKAGGCLLNSFRINARAFMT